MAGGGATRVAPANGSRSRVRRGWSVGTERTYSVVGTRLLAPSRPRLHILGSTHVPGIVVVLVVVVLVDSFLFCPLRALRNAFRRIPLPRHRDIAGRGMARGWRCPPTGAVIQPDKRS